MNGLCIARDMQQPSSEGKERSAAVDKDLMDSEVSAILRALIACRNGATTRTVAVAAGIAPSTAEDALAALAVVGLSEPVGPGRWRPNPGLRSPAASRVLAELEDLTGGNGEGPAPTGQISQPGPPPQKPLPLSQAAHRLGVHPDTLDGWAKEGKVEFTWTVGGRRRFDIGSISERMRRRTP